MKEFKQNLLKSIIEVFLPTFGVWTVVLIDCSYENCDFCFGGINKENPGGINQHQGSQVQRICLGNKVFPAAKRHSKELSVLMGLLKIYLRPDKYLMSLQSFRVSLQFFF